MSCRVSWGIIRLRDLWAETWVCLRKLAHSSFQAAWSDNCRQNRLGPGQQLQPLCPERAWDGARRSWYQGPESEREASHSERLGFWPRKLFLCDGDGGPGSAPRADRAPAGRQLCTQPAPGRRNPGLEVLRSLRPPHGSEALEVPPTRDCGDLGHFGDLGLLSPQRLCAPTEYQKADFLATESVTPVTLSPPPRFFPFQGCTHGIWRVPGQGSNQSCSCRPAPQPQQRCIRALSATYTTAHGNAGSLTHGARPGMEPASSRIPVGFLTRRATMGTPMTPFSTYFPTDIGAVNSQPASLTLTGTQIFLHSLVKTSLPWAPKLLNYKSGGEALRWNDEHRRPHLCSLAPSLILQLWEQEC